MADTARVVPSDIGKKVRASRARVSIRLKSLVVLAAAVAIPALLAAFMIGSATTGDSFFGWLVTQTFTFYGIHVPLYNLALVLAWLLAVVGADMLLARSVHNRIDRLLAWLRDFRASGFVRVPVLPKSEPDEIGDIGGELGIAAAHFVHASEREKDISNEKAAFLTIAAHQLRTPLTALSWSIETLLSPNTPEEKRNEIMPQLNSLLKRMQLVVDHILASAKVEEGKFGYMLESVDIVPVLEKVITEFKPLAGDKHIDISLEHGEIPHVYADTERISLALFDLIANAIDYTRDGGKILVTLQPEGDRVRISIADTGIGIAAKDIPFLFTRFYRGENARHIRPDGSGLGLYLVKNIVNNHGSEIVVQSDETKGGSSFSFYLNTQKV